MGVTRQGPPRSIVLHLAVQYAIPNFVETGTFLGSTAHWASGQFERVYTIEFSEYAYRQAVEKYGNIDNISFLYGHTKEKLAEVLSRVEGRSMFWLDAHWSGGKTYGEQDECPLLDELDLINQSQTDNFILIDDARLFLIPPPRPHCAEQWPDIATVIGRLNANHDRYIVILEDIIIAVPGFAKMDLMSYFQDISSNMWHTQQENLQRSGIRRQAERLYRRVTSRLRNRN